MSKNTAVTARFEWKLADLWMGVFWKTSTMPIRGEHVPMQTDIWVCLLPCVPLHITIHRNLNAIPF